MAHYQKDPSAVLDYGFKWVDWLEDGETITAHTITVDQNVVVDSSSEQDGVVTVWLSGGTKGRTAHVVCEVETSMNRKDQRTLPLSIRNR